MKKLIAGLVAVAVLWACAPETTAPGASALPGDAGVVMGPEIVVGGQAFYQTTPRPAFASIAAINCSLTGSNGAVAGVRLTPDVVNVKNEVGPHEQMVWGDLYRDDPSTPGVQFYCTDTGPNSAITWIVTFPQGVQTFATDANQPHSIIVQAYPGRYGWGYLIGAYGTPGTSGYKRDTTLVWTTSD